MVAARSRVRPWLWAMDVLLQAGHLERDALPMGLPAVRLHRQRRPDSRAIVRAVIGGEMLDERSDDVEARPPTGMRIW
jgi:hypothetical protein